MTIDKCELCAGTGWRECGPRSTIGNVDRCPCSVGQKMATLAKEEHPKSCSCHRCRYGERAAEALAYGSSRWGDRPAPGRDYHDNHERASTLQEMLSNVGHPGATDEQF